MNRHKNNGVTLIELIVGLVVVAILASIAIPNFQSVLADSRITSQTSDLVSALALTRSEAVKRRIPVTMCRSTNQTSCATNVTGSGWEKGWIIFTDAGTVATLDGTDSILKVHGPIAGNATITSNFTSPYLQYRATGASKLAVGVSGAFTVCASGRRGRLVSVAQTGRVTTTVTAANCP